MGKIGLIMEREFNQRVRKRSFIITTLVTPLFMVAMMVLPVILSNSNKGNGKTITIGILDKNGRIADKLENPRGVQLLPADTDEEKLAEKWSNYMIIGPDIFTDGRDIAIYTHELLTLDAENAIASQIRNIIEKEKLSSYNIENLDRILSEIKSPVSISVFRTDQSGGHKESSASAALGIAIIFGILTYMFIFIYGGMVTQGVIEEKSSRVIEIMVSSVKPFQLMMGKILGIATVALTQFIIWIALIALLGPLVMHLFAGDLASAAAAGGAVQMDGVNPESVAMLRNITDPGFIARMLVGFLIYFIGGYLLYAAMFAALGSAVDNPQDAQQLQLPITLPLILAFVMMTVVARDPGTPMAFWFSIIPFTSPIIMMARLPYGVPLWEILLSVAVLYSSFLVMVWLAGKIYRVGIFMYGKKPTWGEIIKWAKYKY